MAGFIWALFVVVLAVWLIGFLMDFGGGLIHLLLIVAMIILGLKLLTGRRSA